MPNRLHVILFFAACLALLSCKLLFLRKKPVYSNCCHFSPKSLVLRLTCKDESMYVVESFVLGNGAQAQKAFSFEKKITEGASQLIIPIPDDSVRTKPILIKVWIANQTIHDYYINIKPADWKSDKLLFGQLSAR